MQTDLSIARVLRQVDELTPRLFIILIVLSDVFVFSYFEGKQRLIRYFLNLMTVKWKVDNEP